MMTDPVILSMPSTLKANRASCRLVTRNLRSVSPLTGYQRITNPIDARWEIEVTTPPLKDPDWEELEAFFASLDGGAVFFRCHDPRRLYTKGVAAGIYEGNKLNNATDAAWSDGTNFTDGTGWTDASAYGSVGATAALGATHVLLSGLVPNESLSIQFNDRIGIGGLLYTAVKNASSNASGQALVEIRPRLRLPATIGDQVSFVRASTVFTILDIPFMENTPGGVTSFGMTGFTMIEVPEAVLASKGLPV